VAPLLSRAQARAPRRSSTGQIEGNVDRRRLAGAVRPEKAEQFTTLDMAVDIINGVEGTVLLRQGQCVDRSPAGGVCGDHHNMRYHR
jgi:hypothetical protein